MTISYYEILLHLRNFFPDNDKRVEGSFTISENVLTPAVGGTNQWVLIEGSLHNDGLHYHSTAFTTLTDETFSGVITPLKIPKALISLMDEITTWASTETASAYTSESFGGYSYSKASSGAGWQAAFKERLKPWRKI